MSFRTKIPRRRAGGEWQFAWIFLARNSLLHVLTTADLTAGFAQVRRHLAPGHGFAVDVFNPDVQLLARPKHQPFPVM